MTTTPPWVPYLKTVYNVIDTIETDLSLVLFTETTAIKLRKHKDNGFIDYRSTKQRRQYLSYEWQRGSESSPELYRELITVYDVNGKYSLTGENESAVDWAIIMNRFSTDQRLDRLLPTLTSNRLIEGLALSVSNMHNRAKISPKNAFKMGSLETISNIYSRNIRLLRSTFSSHSSESKLINDIKAVGNELLDDNGATITDRYLNGFIRECHGDLHSGNIALFSGRLQLYDYMDGPETLINIDILSDFSMLYTSLEIHSEPMASLLLETYLSNIEGKNPRELLSFYRVHRFLVRARVKAFEIKAGIRSDSLIPYLESVKMLIQKPLH